MHDVETRAALVAIASGHRVTQPLHLVHAIVQGDGGVARAVLASVGATSEAVAEVIRTSPVLAAWTAAEGEQRTRPGPAMQRIAGWASGFAAVRGTPPDDTTYLLALCWTGTFPRQLADPQDVVEALEQHGVAVPALPLPVTRSSGDHLIVEVEPHLLRPMAAALRRRLPAESLRFVGDPATGVTEIRVLASELDERLIDECRAEIESAND